MKKIILAAILSLPTAGFASGQEEPPPQNDDRCWYFSKTFTEGVVLPQGNGLIKCGEGGVWAPTQEEDANCLYDSNLFGIGALVVLDDKATKLECQASGQWKEATP